MQILRQLRDNFWKPDKKQIIYISWRIDSNCKKHWQSLKIFWQRLSSSDVFLSTFTVEVIYWQQSNYLFLYNFFVSVNALVSKHVVVCSTKSILHNQVDSFFTTFPISIYPVVKKVCQCTEVNDYWMCQYASPTNRDNTFLKTYIVIMINF